MNISSEEKLMYKVMMAIYESGIPISFKGSMVLKACLVESGYNEETRHTVDIDANWYSDEPPTSEQMIESLQKVMKDNNIDIDVRMYRMYGEGRSAGFELTDISTGELLFSMDIDVNRPIVPTRVYEIDGVRFIGISPVQMIADKLSVISTDKVFRRIKDVVDLYYLSHVFKFACDEVLQAVKRSGKELGGFDGFINRKDELRHSYEKFRFSGDVYKPDFEEVYQTVNSYIYDAIPNDINQD